MDSRASLFLALVVVLVACCQAKKIINFEDLLKNLLGPEFHQIGDKHYFIEMDAAVDWDAASLICQSKYARLARFDNIDEMNAVAEVLKIENFDNYEGLWTSGSGFDLLKKKRFTWRGNGGGEINKDLWHWGEPNVNSCVRLSKKHDKFALNNIACSYKIGFICQANS